MLFLKSGSSDWHSELGERLACGGLHWAGGLPEARGKGGLEMTKVVSLGEKWRGWGFSSWFHDGPNRSHEEEQTVRKWWGILQSGFEH